MKKINLLKKSLIISSTLALALGFASCQKNSGLANYNYQEEGINSKDMLASAPKKMAARAMMADNAVAESIEYESNSSSGAGDQQSINTERKLIKNGNISLEVQDLSTGEQSIEEWAKGYNGYIENSSSNENNAWFTVKVPAKSFEEAMQTVGDLGIVKSRGISSQDVSEQYYDLETRLSTKKVMRDNLKRYLAQATNLTDILKIERELNNVLSEIESMEGRMRRLSNQIDYATISVNLSLPGGKTSPVIHKPTFGENLTEFFAQTGAFFAACLKILAYAIVCGIPVIAFLALLFWLLFGKIGLVKKLFKKLK